MKRLRSLAGCVAALAALSATPPRAHADAGLDLGRSPAPAGDDGVWVHGPDARGHGTLRARLSVAYARDPLVLVSSDLRGRRVVAEQQSADLGLSLALFHRLLVYAHLPVSSASSDERRTDAGVSEPAPGEALGLADARLGARVRVLGPVEEGLRLAAATELWLPTGAEARYSGDGQLRARLLAIGGASFAAVRASLQAGLVLRGSERLSGILPTRTGNALALGLSARAPLDRARHVWLGPELEAELVVGDGARLFDPRSTLAHALLALRVRPGLAALELGAGFGPGLGQGAGSADARAVVFVGWSPEAPPPPPDADADGVPDRDDICLNLPGQPSNDPLMHGCPEAPLDTDGDSIPDGFDACPRLPGEPTGVRATHGCPKRADRDGDGFPDAIDACPSQRGPDSSDPARRGCPAPPPAATVVQNAITISEQVRFETGTAVLHPASDAILAAVASALNEHPELELVEIQGHTDDTGTPERNQRLSQERADAVARWLVEHGIRPARLRTVGYGQARPLADNTSEVGRAQNRRVEFRIIRRAAPERP